MDGAEANEAVSEEVDSSPAVVDTAKPKMPYAQIDTSKLDDPSTYEKPISTKKKKKKITHVKDKGDYQNMQRLEIGDWGEIQSLGGRISLHEQVCDESNA